MDDLFEPDGRLITSELWDILEPGWISTGKWQTIEIRIRHG